MDSKSRDFDGALAEVESNLDIRRLLLVIMHVLLPALALAVADALAAPMPADGMLWFHAHICAVSGAVLAVAGLLVCIVLARCHLGLVVNGSKIAKLERGEVRIRGLNWLGVTTNFVALTALAGAGGLTLLLAALGLGGLLAILCGAGFFVLCFLAFRINHARANRLVRRLEGHWEGGGLRPEQEERHAQESLNAANADISIVVTMAAALFAGLYNAITVLLGASEQAAGEFAAETVRSHSAAVLGGYLWISSFLSLRMLARLRLAIGDESARLARLREEPDDPWRFRLLERSFLLFQLSSLFAAAALLVFVSSLGHAGLGGVLALAQWLLGTIWWALLLRVRARRAGVAAARLEE